MKRTESFQKKLSVLCYLSKNSGEIYDTVRVIGSHEANKKKINFLYGCTNEAAYAKLILAYSIFKVKNDIEKFLNTEVNSEFFDK